MTVLHLHVATIDLGADSGACQLFVFVVYAGGGSGGISTHGRTRSLAPGDGVPLADVRVCRALGTNRNPPAVGQNHWL